MTGLAAAIVSGGCAQRHSAPGPITRKDAVALLAKLDAAISQQSIDEYRQLSRPLHPVAHEPRLRWLETAIADGPWIASSRVTEFGVIAGCGVALVTSKLRRDSADDPGEGYDTTHYVAFTGRGEDARVILDIDVFEEELPADPLQNRSGTRFGCGACNYSIGALDGWLLVPHLPQRAGLLEAISFYSLQHTASVDLSIHVTHRPVDPRALLTKQLRSRGADDTSVDAITAWLPPSYRAEPPAGLAGATVEIPGQDPESGVRTAWRTRLHVISFGPIVYVMTVNATAEDLAAHADQVHSILASFMLRETDPKVLASSVRPVERHSGGKLEGTTYVNPALGVTFEGPADSVGTLRCGPHPCHVVFTCPDGTSRLSLRTLAPPLGRTRWTAAAADWTIAYGLRGRIKDADTDWQQNNAGERIRTLRLHDEDGDQLRVLRAILAPSGARLHLLDARSTTARTLADLERHFESLVR